MFEKLGGRKAVVTFVLAAAGTAIDLATDRGLSENLLYLFITIISVFVTGNVLSKKVVLGAKSPDSPAPTPTIEDPELQQAMDEMAGKLEELEGVTADALSQLATSISNIQKTNSVILQRMQGPGQV